MKEPENTPTMNDRKASSGESANEPKKWSDATKWAMGIVSAVIVSLLLSQIPKLFPGRNDVSNKRLVINATLYNVINDDKGSVIAAREIPSSTPAEVDSSAVNELVSWIQQELQLSDDMATVEVVVIAPADWQSESLTLTRVPDGPIEYFLSYFPNNGNSQDKIRIPLTANTLQSIAGVVEKCTLEIRIPGFGSRNIELVTGETVWKRIVFEPSKVGIGVETFSGEIGGVADVVVARLATHPRIRVMAPEALDRVREEIKAHIHLDESPSIQEIYRDLSVDYILSGTVLKKSNDETDDP